MQIIYNSKQMILEEISTVSWVKKPDSWIYEYIIKVVSPYIFAAYSFEVYYTARN